VGIDAPPLQSQQSTLPMVSRPHTPVRPTPIEENPSAAEVSFKTEVSLTLTSKILFCRLCTATSYSTMASAPWRTVEIRPVQESLTSNTTGSFERAPGGK